MSSYILGYDLHVYKWYKTTMQIKNIVRYSQTWVHSQVSECLSYFFLNQETFYPKNGI